MDANPALLEHYSDKVPVLSLGGSEICRYRLDETALRELLRQ